MSATYELTDMGFQLARKTNFPDNPNFAIIHALYKCHRLSSKGLAEQTGLGKGEVAVALRNCLRQQAIVEIGDIFIK